VEQLLDVLLYCNYNRTEILFQFESSFKIAFSPIRVTSDILNISYISEITPYICIYVFII